MQIEKHPGEISIQAVREIRDVKAQIPTGFVFVRLDALSRHESSCIFEKPDIFQIGAHMHTRQRAIRSSKQPGASAESRSDCSRVSRRQAREIIWDKLPLRHFLCTLSWRGEIFIHMKVSFTWSKTKLAATECVESKKSSRKKEKWHIWAFSRPSSFVSTMKNSWVDKTVWWRFVSRFSPE